MKPKHFIPLLLSAALLLGLTSCGGADTERSPFAYADGAFTVTVRGTICRTLPVESGAGETLTGVPRAVSAVVSATAPGASGERVLTVTYTDPDALRGLTVTRALSAPGADAQPGTPLPVTDTLTLEDMTVTDTRGTYARLLDPVLALLPEGDVTAASPDPDGTRRITVTAPTRTAVYTLLPGRRLPSEVTVTGEGYEIRLTCGEG